MGTRMVHSYPNIFMHYLQERILLSISVRSNVWYRYINGIFLTWSNGEEE